MVAVLGCHWDALQVYQHCQQTVVGGGFGLVYLGVAAAECRAAVELLGIERGQWPAISELVQQLGHLVAQEINARSNRR